MNNWEPDGNGWFGGTNFWIETPVWNFKEIDEQRDHLRTIPSFEVDSQEPKSLHFPS